MNPEYATQIVKAMMITAVTIVSPILITAMVIGLAISLFQTITSIQEQTLTFFPKSLGVAALIVLLLPWLLRTVTDFTISMIRQMPEMVY